MPGNCGTEARSFRNSTDWFREESYFSILPHLLNRLKELWKLERVCVKVVTLLVSIKKNQVEELTPLGLRAFAIGLGDEKKEAKGEKTFDHVSIFIAFRWRTLTSRWLNRGRSLRTTSWCFTLIRWIYQLLQMFIATACYYCAKMNHTNDLSGTRKARQLRKFTPQCKLFPSCSTSAAKTTLSWPDAASSSLYLNLLKTETTGTLFPWGGFSNFSQKRQIRSRSTCISSRNSRAIECY